MNSNYYETLDENFAQALKMYENDYTNEELIEMLKNGKYPPVLKARIMSNQGHLSNDAAARIASILCDDSRIKQLVLGHISENNNTEQKAYDAVENALKAKDSDIELYVAHQSRRSEVFEIL